MFKKQHGRYMSPSELRSSMDLISMKKGQSIRDRMQANSNIQSRETFAGKFDDEPSIGDTNPLGHNLLAGASTETANSVSTIQEHSE